MESWPRKFYCVKLESRRLFKCLDAVSSFFRCSYHPDIGAVLAEVARAQSKLELKVHTGRGVNGYDVNSTMISGEEDMLLIDRQFSLSEAHGLAAEILESKKNLAVIYVTHAHPDHMFGLAVLKQAFPQAKILALPGTVNAAKTGWPARQKFWFATYGKNIPGPDPVLPEELPMPFLTLEGQQFPVTGPVQGSDGAETASFSFLH
jgi:glyoxylase-like metal-dependent hydrolase (beta-lactamase superfamily II)